MGKHPAVRLAKRFACYLAISVAIAALSNAFFDPRTWQYWTLDLFLCVVAGLGVAVFNSRRSLAPIDSTKEAA